MIFLIAIGLSMDAFSLSLAYGLNIEKKIDIYKISVTVGIFHFIMPLLGNLVGIKILKILPFESNILIGIIFLYLGIEMLLENKNEIEDIKTSYLKILLFSLAVSIDSFSVGIGLSIITSYKIFAYLTFSLISFLFTTIGLIIGRNIHSKLGLISKLLGSILLIILAIIYFIK